MASSDKTLLWLRQTVRPFELAMSVLPLRAEKARGHLAFAPELAEQSEGTRREFFRQTCRTGTRQFLVSYPQPLALLGTRTLLSRCDKFSRNWLRNRFRACRDLRTFSTNAASGQRNCPLAIEFSVEESSLVNQPGFIESTALNDYLSPEEQYSN